jgi:hypothetical protein
VASDNHGLLCMSGFHRPFDLCEGRQSWRRPNCTLHSVGHLETKNAHDR